MAIFTQTLGVIPNSQFVISASPLISMLFSIMFPCMLEVFLLQNRNNAKTDFHTHNKSGRWTDDICTVLQAEK